MRVADYIFKYLADCGIKHVFTVTGGGAMHLNDALGKEKRIKYICNLHEQACAIAAEGYARISNRPGVICVTTGPGGTNAITGVMGAWVDSIPMIIISGQVKTSTMISSFPELKLRQLGDQEINICDIVKPITKYSVVVHEKEKIRYHLEKAWHLAVSGKPGPVWLDIPLDIQSAELENTATLRGYQKDELPCISYRADIDRLIAAIKKAERPVIIAGNGISLAGVREEFKDLVNKLKIPLLTSISGIDLISSDSEYFFGRPGILGERPANFIMQNADLLIILGTRMNLRVIGFAYEHFAREALKVMVDIDEAELNKPTLGIDVKINADLKHFIKKFDEIYKPKTIGVKKNWIEYCRALKHKYPVVTDKHRNRTDYVSSYYLPEVLSENLKGDEIIITGNGIAYTSTYQAISLKKNNRMFANVACASMGYGLPAAIGAALAGSGKNIICLTGDGSIQMNIQELQTVLNYRLPIKLFIYNNDGYLSIKLTQNAFFNGNYVGSNPESGVVLPSIKKISDAYGFKYYKLENNQQTKKLMPEILSHEGALICEVILDPLETPGPKASSQKLPDGTMISKPLEDMYPFLPREEFLKEMIVAPIKE